MNHSASENNEQPDDAGPPSGRGIAELERNFLRLTFWQTILSVAGVFTGAVALYAALTESQAVREQTAASVWPYVQTMIYDTSRGDSASFSLSLSNVGVGPARMQAMQLTLEGEPVSDWQTLVDTLLGEQAILGTDFGKSSVRRRVLAPGESVTAFQTEHTQLALKLQQAVHSGTIGLAYCYCSIFDECWRKPASDPTGDDPIESAEACTDYGGDGFKD